MVKNSLNKIIVLSVLVIGLASGLMILSKSQVFQKSEAYCPDRTCGTYGGKSIGNYQGATETSTEKQARLDKEKRGGGGTGGKAGLSAPPQIPITDPSCPTECCTGGICGCEGGGGTTGCYCTGTHCYGNDGQGNSWGCEGGGVCSSEFLKKVVFGSAGDSRLRFDDYGRLYWENDDDSETYIDLENPRQFFCSGHGCENMAANFKQLGFFSVESYSGSGDQQGKIVVTCSQCQQSGSTTSTFASFFSNVYSYLQTKFPSVIWKTVGKWIEEPTPTPSS